MYRTIFLILTLISFTAAPSSRVKDIASLENVRENMLIGYGLVVGLSGTGDNMQNTIFTQKGLMDVLEKLGINIQGSALKTKNIAAVTVTASLPAFARQGAKIDVKISALGDAKSLKGGVLLATSLVGADGKVYALAQGQVSLSQFYPADNLVKTKSSNVETVGFIQGGAIVENEVGFELSQMDRIKLSLNNPDFSTAVAVCNAINNNIPGNTAVAIDSGTIQLVIPEYRKADIVEFLAEIEQLTVATDIKARIIVDESTGTIVIGDNVTISPVAIAQGNLMITIGKPPVNPSPGGNRGQQIYMLKGTSLKQLVNGLNKLGVWPRDIVNILQNIKAAGALKADIEVR